MDRFFSTFFGIFLIIGCKENIKKELKVRRFEDRRRVIEKYVEGVYVKHLNGSGKVKECEIKIKLFYDGGDDGDGLFKMIYNTINNSFYIPKTNLAQSKILLYNHLKILLTYNYKTFTSGRTNRNKRKITRFDIPTYYSGD